MPRRIIGSLAGALIAATLAVPVAHAGSPADVTVRVEAPGNTLADATLTTTRAKVVKDRDPTHSCSGTSAAGALEQAVSGNWDATWFDGLGYAVDAIGGAKPASANDYWTLWINGRPSTTGVCDSELKDGDDVLEFICSSTPDFSSCTNLPLALAAVRTRDGRATVKVTLLNGDGTSTPVAGARVDGGAKPVDTAADGTATVALRDGQSLLTATKRGTTASNRLRCQRGARGASCGARDRTPPQLSVAGIANGQTFAAADAPRVLHGRAVDPAGAGVALRLTRRLDGRCSALEPRRLTFRRCGRGGPPLVDAGDGPKWSYLLPARLGPGSYRLDVIAADDAGNRAVRHLAFTVEA
jgi:hypothetical protein